MEQVTTKTIRDIALESPETTRVFEEFKIDFCCGGRKPLEQACQEAGLDYQLISQKIADVISKYNADPATKRPEHESPSQLIDYIVSTHHVFTASEIERLIPLMAKVCSRHGELHPELFELQVIFDALAESLIPHMRKEETVLFPYIQGLESALSGSGQQSPPHFGTVQNPIRMMMADHDTDGARLRKMRNITNDYELPEGACPSFTALFAGLEDLEKDLHRHIHLENNVLFPAAVELEQRTFAAAAA